MGVTRDLAAALTLPGPASNAVMRQGVVTVVNADGTVTLTLGGSAATVTDVVCLANVLPYVGATVWCAEFGQDLLVLGVQETATGWVTSTTGFTAASNFTTTSVRHRVVGNEVDLVFVMTRATSGLAIPADGDVSNTALLTAIPAALTPTVTSYWNAGASGAGRLGSGTITSSGTVNISALSGGGTTLAIGDLVAGHAHYWRD